MSESMISALIVTLVTGAMLTLVLAQAFRSVWIALEYSIPATLVMGGVMALIASEKIKLGGRKPPKED
jgi:hypothetical protein